MTIIATFNQKKKKEAKKKIHINMPTYICVHKRILNKRTSLFMNKSLELYFCIFVKTEFNKNNNKTRAFLCTMHIFCFRTVKVNDSYFFFFSFSLSGYYKKKTTTADK